MKKSNKPEKEKPSPKKERSFTVSLEQLAGLLRAEVKLKDRDTKVLSSTPVPGSFNNSIMQVAKLLRTQVRAVESPEKRSWTVSEKPE